MEKNSKTAAYLSWKALCVTSFLLALLFLVFPVQAADMTDQALPTSQKLIPLGRTTGIKLFSEGTMIVGFADVAESGGASPAKQAGLQCGDVILSVNDTKIDSNEALMQALDSAQTEALTVVYDRNGTQQTCKVQTVYDAQAETYRMGARQDGGHREHHLCRSGDRRFRRAGARHLRCGHRGPHAL